MLMEMEVIVMKKKVMVIFFTYIYSLTMFIFKYIKYLNFCSLLCHKNLDNAQIKRPVILKINNNTKKKGFFAKRSDNQKPIQKKSSIADSKNNNRNNNNNNNNIIINNDTRCYNDNQKRGLRVMLSVLHVQQKWGRLNFQVCVS
jgi:hypothetical protein